MHRRMAGPLELTLPYSEMGSGDCFPHLILRPHSEARQQAGLSSYTGIFNHPVFGLAKISWVPVRVVTVTGFRQLAASGCPTVTGDWSG